ncbi:hypothetical protein [Microbacterium gilvum]|uniref:Uncharacterized protein n=1 Tax=Microbacterium gilvum TaxID=1336204 RepID=A0ABP8ZR73_9MICO
MAIEDVGIILSAYDGGFNGEVEGKQIRVVVESPESVVLTLTEWEDDRPTDRVERYQLTVTPIVEPAPAD